MTKADHNKFSVLLKEELQEIYNASNLIFENLPSLEKETFTPELKQYIKENLEETKVQIGRLEKALSTFDKKTKSESTSSISGLIDDIKRISKSYEENSPLKDAALIGAVKRIEHYLISYYGTTISHAKQLKLDDIVVLLQQNLDEALAADQFITKIAEGTFYAGGVNAKAMKTEKTPK